MSKQDERRINAVTEAMRGYCGFNYKMEFSSRIENGKYIFSIDFNRISPYEKKQILKPAIEKLDRVMSCLKKEHDIDCLLKVHGLTIDTPYSDEKALIARVTHDAFGDLPIPSLFECVEYVPPSSGDLLTETWDKLSKAINDIAAKHDAKAKVSIINGKRIILESADKRKAKKYSNFIEDLNKTMASNECDPDSFVPDYYKKYDYYKSSIARIVKKSQGRRELGTLSYNFEHNRWRDSSYWRNEDLSNIHSLVTILDRLGVDTTEIKSDLRCMA